MSLVPDQRFQALLYASPSVPPVPLDVARHPRPRMIGVPLSTGVVLPLVRTPKRLTFGPGPTARLRLHQRRPTALARVITAGFAAMAGARDKAARRGTAKRHTYGFPLRDLATHAGVRLADPAGA